MRRSDSYRFGFILVWAVSATAAASTPPEPHPALVSAEAELTARAAERHPKARIEVEWSPLAAVVSQRACETFETQSDPVRVSGALSVRVHCHGDAPWSFFARARVSVFQHAVIALAHIPRGTPLTPDRVTLEELDIGNERGYFSSVHEVSRLIARRTIRAGATVRPASVTHPPAVERGQNVRILAEHGAALIATTGVALESGKTGDQISVKNARSGKVIRTWIRSVGTVATRP